MTTRSQTENILDALQQPLHAKIAEERLVQERLIAALEMVISLYSQNVPFGDAATSIAAAERTIDLARR